MKTEDLGFPEIPILEEIQKEVGGDIEILGYPTLKLSSGIDVFIDHIDNNKSSLFCLCVRMSNVNRCKLKDYPLASPTCVKDAISCVKKFLNERLSS